MRVSVKFEAKAPEMFGKDMLDRLVALDNANLKALKDAARTATQVTQRSFTYRRDIAPPRAGRFSTGGRMTRSLKWGVTSNDQVAFDTKTAATQAPHWVIQEIGTGRRAQLKRGGDPAATTVRSIPRQRGRRIKAGLVFARGGRFVPPGGRGRDQIYRASEVKGVPMRQPAIRISREIKGQSFVKKGAEAGFRQYETTLRAAARQAFLKTRKP